jgi:hypothetical protein
MPLARLVTRLVAERLKFYAPLGNRSSWSSIPRPMLGLTAAIADEVIE